MKTTHPILFIALLVLALTPRISRAQQAEAIHRSDVQDALRAAPERTIPQDVSDPKLTKSADPETGRSYTKDAIVVTHSSGIVERRPYAAIPILFKVDTAELLDSVSRQNVRETAAALRALGQNAKFVIEGHASAEGSEKRNDELSELRAAKIRSLLVESEGIDGGRLTDRGFGSKHAAAGANSPEAERQKDRRVLVVRVQ